MMGDARLKGFLWHLAVYFGATVAGFGVNIAIAPERLIVWLPLLLWGGAVAVQCAWVMGLVGARGGQGRE